MKFFLFFTLFISQFVCADVNTEQTERSHKKSISIYLAKIRQHPEQLINHLDIAKHYYALHQFKSAAKHVAFVLSKEIPAPVRKNAENFYQLILKNNAKQTSKAIPTGTPKGNPPEKKQSPSAKKTFSGQLQLASGYNNNSNDFPDSAKLTDTIELTSTQLNTYYQTMNAYVAYRWQQSKWSFTPTTSLYVKGNYDKAQQNNIVVPTLAFNSKYRAKKWGLSLPVSASYIYSDAGQYSRNSAISYSFGGSLSLTPLSINSNWRISSQLKYYYDTPNNADKNGLIAEQAHYWLINSGVKYQYKIGVFSPSVSSFYQQKNTKIKDTGYQQINATVSLPMSYKKLNLQATLNYYYKTHESRSSIYNNQRIDHNWQTSFHANYQLPYESFLKVGVNYTLNKANQRVYQFQRQTFNVGFGIRF
jgi:hypothetical protein